jgi:hypothetical protein
VPRAARQARSAGCWLALLLRLQLRRHLLRCWLQQQHLLL